MAVFARRPVHWIGGLIVVALVVGGAAVAYDGYTSVNTPSALVTRYLQALADADAPAALALGDLPAGPHTLLTSDVLRAQRRNAPIRDVVTGPVERTGTHARVHVTYLLDWPAGERAVSAVVPVHQADGRWRLDRVAVATELDLQQATQRATVAGGSIPHGTVLLFPGAAPISFDTPYLQLAPTNAAVPFAPGPTVDVEVQASDAARREASQIVSAALLRCVSSQPRVDCPQPSDRYVPGSLHGALTGATPQLAVTVGDSPAGLLEVSGRVAVDGTYRLLTFANRAVAGKGRVSVYVHASGYAVAPLRFVWTNA